MAQIELGIRKPASSSADKAATIPPLAEPSALDYLSTREVDSMARTLGPLNDNDMDALRSLAPSFAAATITTFFPIFAERAVKESRRKGIIVPDSDNTATTQPEHPSSPQKRRILFRRGR